MLLLLGLLASLYLVGFYRWVLHGGALAARAANASVPWETPLGRRANIAVDFVAQLLIRAVTYHLLLICFCFQIWLGFLAFDLWGWAWALLAWAMLALPVVACPLVIWCGTLSAQFPKSSTGYNYQEDSGDFVIFFVWQLLFASPVIVALIISTLW